MPKVIADGQRDTVIELVNNLNMVTSALCIYVNGAPVDPMQPPGPANPPTWMVVDFTLVMTARQPVVWTVSQGRVPDPTNPTDPGVVPPVQQPFTGELKCVETDVTGAPLGGNALTAEATIIDPDGDVGKYDGITIPGISVNSDPVLHLDDVEYGACPAELRFTHPADGEPDLVLQGDPVSNFLTLVPCTQNLDLGSPGQVLVMADVSDEFEQRLSGTFQVDCWRESTLTALSPAFMSLGSTVKYSRLVPRGKCEGGTSPGTFCKVNSDCPGGGECRFPGLLGVLETVHPATAGAAASAIRNLHTFGSMPGATMTLPSLP